jgi:hypothetical protein
MGDTLTEKKNSEETSLEDAQEISDKLEDLFDEKQKRIQEEMQDSEPSKNTNSRCTKMGKVDNISRLEGEGEDKVRIDIEYVDNAETEMASFLFKVPEDEEDIHIDNRLIRFIKYVGDGSTVDLNKVMYREVPLIVGKNGDVEIDIPEVGRIPRIKNSLRRRSIDIMNRLDISVSIDGKSVLYLISSILCMVVGFLAFQISIEAGLEVFESELQVISYGMMIGIVAAIFPIGTASLLIVQFVSDYTSNTFAYYLLITLFTLSFLILGVLAVNNGIVLKEDTITTDELKFMSGLMLPLLSIAYSYMFLSELNIKTHIMSIYRRISKRQKLKKGPEYLE